jgi:hypothetical protein
VDNIKMQLVDIGWGGIGWIGLAQDRDRCGALVNKALGYRVPQNVGRFLNTCKTAWLSRRGQPLEVS